VEAIRNVPLLLIVVFSYLGLALGAFPRVENASEPLGLAVVSNRGVVLPWVDGAGQLLGLLVVAGVAAWGVARWRRSVADRTGRPSRAGMWALGVAAIVVIAGWALLGLTATLPERDGRTVDGGLRLSPEFFAILFALVIYTSSHIAEIVRGSIQAVHRGQAEAAQALALSPFQRLRFVILPQAFRIAIPPLGNQYLNLLKNSSLGAVVSYYDLALVTSISVANGAPAVPAYLLTLAIYVVLSLTLSAVVNVVNRHLALETR
jgi:general L-amino acid transport system permease protein